MYIFIQKGFKITSFNEDRFSTAIRRATSEDFLLSGGTVHPSGDR